MMIPIPSGRATPWLLLLVALALAPGASEAIPPGASAAPGDSLRPEAARGARPVLERIDLEGNTRTATAVALARLPLIPGRPLDGDALLAAAEALRRSGLFSRVEAHARPGTTPGSVVAVFRVRENTPRVRFGAGYDDLAGWYLIPAELDLDNVTGHGETIRLAARLGYRTAGVELRLRSAPEILRRSAWEARLRAEGDDRIYFVDRTELKHHVERGAVALGFDAPVGPRLTAGAAVEFETVEPDSSATVYRESRETGREQGDDIPFEELPPGVRDDLGREKQARLTGFVSADARSGEGLLARGWRARLVLEGVRRDSGNFPVAVLDARGYAPLRPGLQLAARARVHATTVEAPFFERFHLGGLYTVRGYPSQSLSPPEGDLGLATLSCEIRSAWIGSPRAPRLTGLVFADAGWAGEGGPSFADVAVGVGWGVRVRVPWIHEVGLDVGVPLSDAPVRDSFHVNLGFGWTY